jgi:hypothetical protein
MNEEQFQKLYQGYLDQSLSESEVERFFGAIKGTSVPTVSLPID